MPLCGEWHARIEQNGGRDLPISPESGSENHENGEYFESTNQHNAEQTHLIPAGSIDQLMVGPISRPKDGPTFPNELSVIVMAFVLSIPAEMIANEAKRHIKR